MPDTTCTRCQNALPEGARFCPRCGFPVETGQPVYPPVEGELKPRFSIFWLSLLGSLALTGILTLVLGWPVFILGAFLPLFWFRRR